MSLRRKLLVTFGALGALAAVIAAVSFWTNGRYRETDAQLQRHYGRSLYVQRIRSTTFRAIKEPADAVFSRDPDARAEFESRLRPALPDFRAWRALADSADERREVARVRASFDRLVADARRVFAGVEAGRRDEAARLLETTLEDRDLDDFQRTTDLAVTADRRKRTAVRAQAADARRTGQLVLLISAFGAVSTVFLVAAYLASDLFGPLQRLTEALEAARRGDRERRLDEERRDELGVANTAFNGLMEDLARRERTAASARDGSGELPRPPDLTLARTDVRALLYELAAGHQDELARKGASLEIDIAPDVHWVLADRPQLREALTDVVRGALAGLPDEGGRLGLRAQRDRGGVVLDVADNGEGRGPARGDGESDGDGGAAEAAAVRARAVVERHGGELRAVRVPEEGTLVRITLPLRDPA